MIYEKTVTKTSSQAFSVLEHGAYPLSGLQLILNQYHVGVNTPLLLIFRLGGEKKEAILNVSCFLLKAEIRASGQLYPVFIPQISPTSQEECWTEWMFHGGKRYPQDYALVYKSSIFFGLDVQKQLRIFDI